MTCCCFGATTLETCGVVTYILPHSTQWLRAENRAVRERATDIFDKVLYIASLRSLFGDFKLLNMELTDPLKALDSILSIESVYRVGWG